MINLTKMILSKRFFLSFFLLTTLLSLFSQKRIEYYRSNSNGLALVKINLSQRNDYKFVLKVDLTGDIVLLKLLYKEKEESKRWEYSYIENNILESERYFKDNN